MSAITVTKVHTLTGHRDCIYTLERYNDQCFFSAGGDGMVVLWDLTNAETGKMIVKVPASVYGLSYNPSRQLLVVGQNFSGIHLVDVEKKKEVGSIALTASAIFDIQTTDEAIFVATGAGEVFRLSWDLQILAVEKPSEQSARTIAIHPNQTSLAVGFSDNCVRILDGEDLSVKKAFKAHDISVFTLCYHPHLPVLISGSRDARIKFWDVDQDYSKVEEIVGHLYAINHIGFSPNGQHFVTCSMDKSLKVWDSQNFKLLKVIDKARHAGHATSVNKILWMRYSNWLVSCSDDRTISIWDISL